MQESLTQEGLQEAALGGDFQRFSSLDTLYSGEKLHQPLMPRCDRGSDGQVPDGELHGGELHHHQV